VRERSHDMSPFASQPSSRFHPPAGSVRRRDRWRLDPPCRELGDSPAATSVAASPPCPPTLDSQQGTDASRCKTVSPFVYAVRVSRSRLIRRSAKARRHAAAKPAPTEVIRETARVERLAYTRTQAAEALGVSRSTFDRRVLPLIETVEMPWGTRLIPVDELKRLIAERRRRPARAPLPPAKRGRPRVLSSELVDHIRGEREAGRTLRQIATDLNERRVPTAQGGAQWWPSTVRAVLGRSGRLASRHVLVAVGVDADHVVQLVCKHPTDPPSPLGGSGAGLSAEKPRPGAAARADRSFPRHAHGGQSPKDSHTTRRHQAGSRPRQIHSPESHSPPKEPDRSRCPSNG
jgi:hypothetical protein